MKYRIEYYHENGVWIASAWYTQPTSSLPNIVRRAHAILNFVPLTIQYRVLNIESSEIVVEFNHDNIWLLERML